MDQEDSEGGGENDRNTETPDFWIDSGVKPSNAYETLKNQCMLSAVL